MRRLVVVMLAVFLVLVLAGQTVGQATHTDYTFESWNFFLDDPNNHIKHGADGWLLVEDLPLGGNYTRTLRGVDETGDLSVTVSGKISQDFANGNFYGSVSLAIEGQSCTGRFRGKRENFFESGSWVLHCPDGSQIRETWQFVFDGSVPWHVTGSGTLLKG